MTKPKSKPKRKPCVFVIGERRYYKLVCAAADASAQRTILLVALRDALDILDRVQSGKGEWSVAEVKRLEKIRALERSERANPLLPSSK